MEHGFKLREKYAREHTEQQRKYDLDERIDQYGNNTRRAADHRLGNAGADRKYHRIYCIIQCDDGQQTCERAFGLVSVAAGAVAAAIAPSVMAAGAERISGRRK